MAATAPTSVRTCITIQGTVQGVGFRPFIYRLAGRYGLSGAVTNSGSGVEIVVEGEAAAIDRFCTAIDAEKPAAAHILRLDRTSPAPAEAPTAPASFRILASSNHGRRTILPPPDLDLCDLCQRELLNPTDRRFHYPFISCTDCGPRYTLATDLPFDRNRTTMAAFPLCAACDREYHDPADRRFHAQTTCCPECGPQLTLLDAAGSEMPGKDIVSSAAELLRAGKIVAIKGVGGFHLAVDTGNHEAVQRLRLAKGRPEKPLAIMAKDLETIQTLAQVSPAEAELLCGRSKPILLLEKKDPFPLPAALAPNNRHIGIMLPYTPLHHLLLAASGLTALAMTSGNRSGEPIVTDNREAVARLAPIADALLVHDRAIVVGCDDSVLRCDHGAPLTLRQGRGLTPTAIPLPRECGATLALGGNDKNTVCLTRTTEAFISQHLGDLNHLATMERFAQAINHLQHLLGIHPDLLVHDLHPDYPSSRYAADQNALPCLAVQHHHAHAVSCMAEHGLTEPVLALTLDGSGFGPDHTIWGGELLLARLDSYERLAHLAPVAMPGGEQAVREPWRMAASFAYAAMGPQFHNAPPAALNSQAEKLPTLTTMIDRRINSPLTSSCGRLFDGVAALLGCCQQVSFDGQAAMQLEAIALHDAPGRYPLRLTEHDQGPLQLATAPLILAVNEDLERGVDRGVIAGRFHHSLAALFAAGCRAARDRTGISKVVCSGGVFQNGLFTTLLTKELEANGFTVYTHHRVPPNDGGLSLGQAVAGRTIFQEQQS